MTDYNNITPQWVKNAVFYQIFPDRFAWSPRVQKPGNFESWNSLPSVHGFKGGDLMGVYEKLDYLEDLGINAIYFTPIFQSASNHRYHTHDYYQVDPLLGGNTAFRTLLDEAHRRNIRIVLDGVFNHASRGFFAFNHILECGEHSPYIDWFTVHGFPMHAYEGKANYECWWSLPALPKLNVSNPQVRKYIMDIARYWIDFGIDGWRLDVPFEINDDSFWQEFRQVVKQANPEAYIVGEIPSEAQRWLQGDQFDAVMNYQITHACMAFFGGNKLDRELAQGVMGLSVPTTMDAPAFARRSEDLLKLYPQEFSYAQMNLLDSHDMPRFLSLVAGDAQRLYLAWAFLMTYPGAPCLFYGDEIGLDGGRDPLCRKAFPWDKDLWNTELQDKLRELITLRHAMPVLRTGTYQPIFAEGQAMAYLRQNEEESALVLINVDESARTVKLQTPGCWSAGTSLQDQLSDALYTVGEDQQLQVNLPPFSVRILA